MKRHTALLPLSREHHNALILAQLIKKDAPAYKGMPTDTQGKINYAVDFFETDLRAHFYKEEVVLEKVKHVNVEIDTLAKEIIAEHEALKNHFIQLKTAVDKIAALDELGKLLEAHIRKEERVLFPLIQQHCSEELLAHL
ncbi:MAG: hemerythrin domain-containing protein [Chitinophagaceae bacterium]|nr:hemerythrin domain-containing protein [Chitinophagaceae bacterium]